MSHATDVTFKKAQRVRSNPSEQKTLPMEGEPPEDRIQTDGLKVERTR